MPDPRREERQIRGRRIIFVIASTMRDDDTTIPTQDSIGRSLAPASHAMTNDQCLGRLQGLVEALDLIPDQHLDLLVHVPIIVTVRLAGSRYTGSGWYPPGGASRGEATVETWRRPGAERNTGIPGEYVQQLDADNGLIAVSRFSLNQDYYQLSILHETGHCVDYHANEDHTGLIPPQNDDRDSPYRDGNGPYQGQRYEANPGSVKEKAAEAYSRLFLHPRTMCRGLDGTPACRSHSEPRCSLRMQRDLQRTDAFWDVSLNYLPLLLEQLLQREDELQDLWEMILGPGNGDQTRRVFGRPHWAHPTAPVRAGQRRPGRLA
jgi:hypothetical protein